MEALMTKKKRNELLCGLTHEMAISVLSNLCNGDAGIAKTVLEMVEAELRQVDADEVAKEVFYSLNALDVDELYDHSGKTRYGYHDPTDVAYEMTEGAIDPFVRDIEKYRKLGMKDAEKETCRGVLRGLLLYDAEGDNEFRDWIPDGASEFADDIIHAYGEHNSEADIADIKRELEAED
jgi:hypothetical protein